jgi:hypothetical protein
LIRAVFAFDDFSDPEFSEIELKIPDVQTEVALKPATGGDTITGHEGSWSGSSDRVIFGRIQEVC